MISIILCNELGWNKLDGEKSLCLEFILVIWNCNCKNPIKLPTFNEVFVNLKLIFDSFDLNNKLDWRNLTWINYLNHCLRLPSSGLLKSPAEASNYWVCFWIWWIDFQSHRRMQSHNSISRKDRRKDSNLKWQHEILPWIMSSHLIGCDAQKLQPNHRNPSNDRFCFESNWRSSALERSLIF